MLTLGDVKCQYLVGLDKEEVGKITDKMCCWSKKLIQKFTRLESERHIDGSCTKGIHGWVLIDTLQSVPLIDPWSTLQLTPWLTLDQHYIDMSVESWLRGASFFTSSHELVDTWLTIHQLLTNRVFIGISMEMSWIKGIDQD